MSDTTNQCPANVRRAIAADRRFDALRPRLRPFQFLYIDVESMELLYSIPAADGHLFIVGHPDHGSYEWIYHDACLDKITNSDCGWGGCDAAMRDALKRLD